MKQIVFVLSIILCFSVLQAQNNTLPTPYFHTLDNGMQVALLENHSSPMVAMVVIVGVGSREESTEFNGAAHMLEHLLFNGTESRTQEKLYDQIDFYGLYLNAHTDIDYTNFMLVAQQRVFDQGMDILSDMLFNSTLPAEKLEKERGIVIEEIVKDLNDEDSRISEQFNNWFYQGTPYDKPVIGNKETIKAMSRDDIYKFYKDFYFPANMQAIVIGNFNTAEMLDKIKNTFAVPSEKTKQMQSSDKAEISAEKIGIVKSYPSSTAEQAFLVLKAPSINGALAPAFKLWQSYYFSGEQRFKNLVNEDAEVVSQLSASYQYHPAFSHVIFKAKLNKGQSANSFKSAFDKAMTVIADNAPKTELLANVRTKSWVDEVLLTEKLHYFGMMKSQMLAVGGMSAYQYMLYSLPKVSTAQIQLVSQSFANGDRDQRFESNAEFTVQSRPLHSTTGVTKSGKIERKSITLKNGLQVIINSDPGAPAFALHTLVKGRNYLEPEDRAGIADLAQRMLLSGTEEFPGPALRSELERIGATVKVTDSPWIPYDNYYNSPEYSYLRFTTLDQFAEQGISLVAQMLFAPQWTEDGLQQEKQKQLMAIRRAAGNPRAIGTRALNSALFNSAAAGNSPQGTAEGLDAVRLDELQEFAGMYFAPQNMIISLQTAMPVEKAEALVRESFAVTHGEGFNFSRQHIVVPENSYDILKSSEKEQGYILIGFPVHINKNDIPALKVLSLILSDSLSFNLRERQGLAYNIGAGISFRDDMAVLNMIMGTQKTNIEKARDAMLSELSRLTKRSIDQREVEKNTNAYSGRIYMRWIARDVRAYYDGFDQFIHDNDGFTRALLSGMVHVQPADVERVARKYFSNANYIRVIVD